MLRYRLALVAAGILLSTAPSAWAFPACKTELAQTATRHSPILTSRLRTASASVRTSSRCSSVSSSKVHLIPFGGSNRYTATALIISRPRGSIATALGGAPILLRLALHRWGVRVPACNNSGNFAIFTAIRRRRRANSTRSPSMSIVVLAVGGDPVLGDSLLRPNQYRLPLQTMSHINRSDRSLASAFHSDSSCGQVPAIDRRSSEPPRHKGMTGRSRSPVISGGGS